MAVALGAGCSDEQVVGNDVRCRDGARCTTTCDDDGVDSECNVECTAGSDCFARCNEGQSCNFSCAEGATCEFDCTAGECLAMGGSGCACSGTCTGTCGLGL